MTEQKSDRGICLNPDEVKGSSVVIVTFKEACRQMDRGQIKPGDRFCVCSKSGFCKYEGRVTAMQTVMGPKL